MLYGNWNNREYLSDVLNIAAFIVGLANYGENIGQSQAQELLNHLSEDIHAHLKEQDQKIDHILELMGGKKDGI